MDTSWMYSWPPYKAAKFIRDWDERNILGWCTSGFDFIDSSGNDSGSTAGHCGTNQDDMRTGSTWQYRIGYGENNTLWPTSTTSSDAMLVPLLSQGYATNKISITPTFERNVIGRVSRYFHDGEHLCRRGVTSGTWCTVVDDTNWSGNVKMTDPSTGDTILKHLNSAICLDAPLLGGDSGGPVYMKYNTYGAEAAGLNSFEWTDVNGKYHSCFTSIWAEQSATGGTVRISAP
jgi:hypothetical protein